MFQKILVPLDGTELAEGILPFVSQLSGGLQAPMVLLSVIGPEPVQLPSRHQGSEPWLETLGEVGAVNVRDIIHERNERPPYPHETGGPSAEKMLGKSRIEANTRLREVVERLGEKGLRSKPIISVGSPAEEIVRIAKQENCDMIAMSTHGRGMVGRGILGSVTDKVIRSSHVPILTVSPDKAKTYWQGDTKITKIIVPLDGSDLAESALPYIKVLAHRLSLDVLLVRAVKIDGFYSTDLGGFPAKQGADLETKLEAQAVEYLKNMSNRLMAEKINVEWKLLRDEPARSILELAQETPNDLVVLGSHGRSGLTRWARGSVAEVLVRSSGDPVLIIPPKTTD